MGAGGKAGGMGLGGPGAKGFLSATGPGEARGSEESKGRDGAGRDWTVLRFRGSREGEGSGRQVAGGGRESGFWIRMPRGERGGRPRRVKKYKKAQRDLESPGRGQGEAKEKPRIGPERPGKSQGRFEVTWRSITDLKKNDAALIRSPYQSQV